MAEASPSFFAFSVNEDLQATTAPPIPTAATWAARYNGSYGRLIKLTQGVPSTPPNRAFLDKLAEASSSTENTGYGGLFGEDGLREALAKDVSTVYSGDITKENIAITAGCNMAAQIVLQTLAKAGDEVILTTPYYFDHAMACDQLGITVVPLPCERSAREGSYVPNVRLAEDLVTRKTRALILVTPNNPTGAIYSHRHIREFYDMCKRHRIALIIDETYRDFLPPDRLPNHGLFSLPDWDSTLISLYSFSKAFAIPGHRVGAIIASAQLIDQQIVKVLDALLVCAPVPPQKVLEWAIHDPEQRAWRNERRDELIARGQLFREVINAVNARICQERGDDARQGWEIDGLGAYYAFLRHPYGEAGMDQEEVARRLGEQVGVSCLPASFFGQGEVAGTRRNRRTKLKELKEEHLRISIANVLDDGIRELEDRFVIFDRLVREPGGT